MRARRKPISWHQATTIERHVKWLRRQCIPLTCGCMKPIQRNILRSQVELWAMSRDTAKPASSSTTCYIGESPSTIYRRQFRRRWSKYLVLTLKSAIAPPPPPPIDARRRNAHKYVTYRSRKARSLYKKWQNARKSIKIRKIVGPDRIPSKN